MSSCNDIVTVEHTDTSVKGTTLFVEDEPAHHKKGAHRTNTGGCITPSAVYVPANHDKGKDLNVLIWFHGHHVADYRKHIFVKDTAGGVTALRESVDEAEKDVVLVVPFIGHRESKHDPAFVLPNSEGKDVEAYLAKLFDVLEDYVGTAKIGRLVVACHSGSGDMMMKATKALGGLTDTLKECWGFDCWYTNDYTSWMQRHSKQSLYFYLGNGSWASAFRKHWEFAYGTPGNPKKPRLNHVFMAPGFKNPPADLECLSDAEVFQSFDAIQLKSSNGQKLSAYETFRLNTLDPLLDKNPSQWEGKAGGNVKEHYQLVRDLVAPRIVGLFTGPQMNANLIAHMQAQCKAGARPAPPPPPKPGAASASRGKKW